MRNYYKILGLKKNATGDEIRERWIELMKRYHPDTGQNQEQVNGKIKDINEAYQVLKFSSTRMPYDLKMAHEKRRKRSFVQKMILIAAAFLIPIVLMLNLFSSKKPQPPLSSKTMPPAVESIEKIQPAAPLETAHPRPVDKPASSTEKKAASKSAASRGTKTAGKDFQKKVNPSARRSEGRRVLKGHPEPRLLSPPLEAGPHAVEQVKVQEKKAFIEKPAVLAIPSKVQPPISEHPPPLIEVLQARKADAALESIKKPDLTAEPIKRRDPPGESKKREESEPSGGTVAPGPALKRSAFNEEEVKEFCTRYMDRYARRDIDGFLSFFSARAVQNQRERIDQIRKVYTRFFNVSTALRYRMEIVKIFMDEQGAEVKALYEIDQTLKGGGNKTWRGHVRWLLVREEGDLRIISLDYQQQKSL